MLPCGWFCLGSVSGLSGLVALVLLEVLHSVGLGNVLWPGVC